MQNTGKLIHRGGLALRGGGLGIFAAYAGHSASINRRIYAVESAQPL